MTTTTARKTKRILATLLGYCADSQSPTYKITQSTRNGKTNGAKKPNSRENDGASWFGGLPSVVETMWDCSKETMSMWMFLRGASLGVLAFAYFALLASYLARIGTENVSFLTSPDCYSTLYYTVYSQRFCGRLDSRICPDLYVRFTILTTLLLRLSIAPTRASPPQKRNFRHDLTRNNHHHQ
jgi:hypothetical protein